MEKNKSIKMGKQHKRKNDMKYKEKSKGTVPLLSIVVPAVVAIIAIIVSAYTSNLAFNNAREISLASEYHQRLRETLKERNKCISDLVGIIEQISKNPSQFTNYDAMYYAIATALTKILNKSRELTIIGSGAQKRFSKDIVNRCIKLSSDMLELECTNENLEEKHAQLFQMTIKTMAEFGFLCALLSDAAAADYDEYLKGAVGTPAELEGEK